MGDEAMIVEISSRRRKKSEEQAAKKPPVTVTRLIHGTIMKIVRNTLEPSVAGHTHAAEALRAKQPILDYLRAANDPRQSRPDCRP
jgi:hypothetical protein